MTSMFELSAFIAPISWGPHDRFPSGRLYVFCLDPLQINFYATLRSEVSSISLSLSLSFLFFLAVGGGVSNSCPNNGSSSSVGGVPSSKLLQVVLVSPQVLQFLIVLCSIGIQIISSKGRCDRSIICLFGPAFGTNYLLRMAAAEDSACKLSWAFTVAESWNELLDAKSKSFNLEFFLFLLQLKGKGINRKVVNTNSNG